MLEAEVVDEIVICSPHATHTEVTLEALDAGVHVLAEKPLTYDPSLPREPFVPARELRSYGAVWS